LCTWIPFTRCTDASLDFFDVIAYKFNQFGAVTSLQTAVNNFRRKECVEASNHYQDLTCPLEKCLLVFVTQTLLVWYFFTALNAVELHEVDSLTMYRWGSALILQAVVLAGKSDSGR
jgi:hypothetical protein